MHNLMWIIYTVHKLSFSKSNILWIQLFGKTFWKICRECNPSADNLGKFGISLEIILNALKCLTFHSDPYFGNSNTFVYFRKHPLLIYYASRWLYFTVPSGRRGAIFFLSIQMYTSGSTFIKDIEPFVYHYISMPR